MNKKSLEIYSRLVAMCAISRAQLNANPGPRLDEAWELLHKARKCFEDIDYALSPDCVFAEAEEMDFSNPVDITGEALIRCDRAKKILREYLRG